MYTKKELRKRLLLQLKSKDKNERNRETKQLFQRFFTSFEYQNATSIGITISHFPELCTHEAITKLLAEGKQVYCPVTYNNGQMEFILLDTETSFIKTKFGIWEPKWAKDKIGQPELLLVPGLAYAKDTHQRLGFGGGYYDRYLANYGGVSVSLAFPEQVFPTVEWKVNQTDQTINQLWEIIE